MSNSTSNATGNAAVVSVDAVRAQPGSGSAACVMDLVHQLLTYGSTSHVLVHASPGLFNDWPLSSMVDEIQIDEIITPSSVDLARWRLRGWSQRSSELGANVAVALAPGGIVGDHARLLAYVQQPNAIRVSWSQPRFALLHGALRLTIRRSSAIAVQTPVMADRVMRSFGVKPSDIHVVEPALGWIVDEAVMAAMPPASPIAASLSPDQPVVLVLTSNARHKRLAAVRSVVEAANELSVGLRFAITVDQRTGWPPNALFIGRLPHADALRVLSSAKALLFLSDDETYGLPLREAALFGTPAVVADRPYARALEDLGNIQLVSDDPATVVEHLVNATPTPPTPPSTSSLASLIHALAA